MRVAARARLATALLVAALITAGCSQVAAIAPVGGDRVTDVRFAANDVLVGRGVAVLVAPVCTMAADRAVTCTGRAVDGQPITVVSTAADQKIMRVAVGAATVFSGSVQDVLDAAARPAP